MRPVEFNGVIGRTEMQRAEDNRPLVNQHQANVIQNKNNEIKSTQVNKKEETQMNSKYDAKDKGKGFYDGQGNRKKKKEEDGTVTIKQKAGFDVKI
jgi:hypothetical protein